MDRIPSVDLQMPLTGHRMRRQGPSLSPHGSFLSKDVASWPSLSYNPSLCPQPGSQPWSQKTHNCPLSQFCISTLSYFCFLDRIFLLNHLLQVYCKRYEKEENSAGNYFEVRLKYLTGFLNSETISSKEILFICPKINKKNK